MPSRNAKIVVALIVLIVVAVALILLSYSKAVFPGLHIDWEGARSSKHRYPKVLSPVEVDKWLKKVLLCESGPLATSYKQGEVLTVGNATYLTGGRSRKPEHLKKVKKDNRILWQLFRGLYEKVSRTLEKETGESCVYLPEHYPLPGFHVFSDAGWLASGWNVAKVHVDLQYQQLNWKDLDVDKGRTVSYTLPLSLPPGAGLYFLDLYKSDGAHLHKMKSCAKEKVEYETGVLYMHDGHQYHMISPYDKGKPRITLQGHAIYSRKLGKYVLYW